MSYPSQAFLSRAHINGCLQVASCVLVLLVGGCDRNRNTHRKHRETGPDDVSVVPEMLVGARYRGRTGGDEYDDLTWAFDRTHFRIVAGQRGLPADLVTALASAEVTGYRIDGRWSVHDEVLTVTDLAIDGQPLEPTPRTLQVMCTPVIRIQADEHQYMFYRGATEAMSQPRDIPPWPSGTTRVSGSVKFARSSPGWLSVGYCGLVDEVGTISDSATMRSQPDDSGSGSAQTKTHTPRFCRLQLNGSQPATMECMALPPGVYLFYAMWKPPDPQTLEGKMVIKSERWRLQNQFKAKWIIVADRPLGQVNFDLVNADHGEIAVRVPASDSRRSAFLLPWGQADVEPPPLDSEQAWRMARWAGLQIPIEAGTGVSQKIPTGRYRVFVVEHDQPANPDDTLVEYRVTHDKLVTVRSGAVVEVSF